MKVTKKLKQSFCRWKKMDRFEVVFDEEIDNIKLRTRIETAKQIFEEIESNKYLKEAIYSKEEYRILKAKFLQVK